VPTLELLSPQTHGHLRLRPAAGDTPHFVQILVTEFALAATCCPILFTKDASSGGFYAGAMFGFKPGENLLGTAAERGGFVPLMLQREGFFLSERHIAIEREHARFSLTDGDPLFDDSQQPGTALRAIQRTLGEIHGGLEQTAAYIAALTDYKLIESIDISLNFEDGERMTLQGLYTVSLDRLREVDDSAAVRLFRQGHLQPAYIMAASLRHVQRLARLRDSKSRHSSRNGNT